MFSITMNMQLGVTTSQIFRAASFSLQLVTCLTVLLFTICSYLLLICSYLQEKQALLFAVICQLFAPYLQLFGPYLQLFAPYLQLFASVKICIWKDCLVIPVPLTRQQPVTCLTVLLFTGQITANKGQITANKGQIRGK